jgi:hypothetical protein
MRGHHALIEMRTQGYAPACVWLDVNEPRLPMPDDWQENSPRDAHLQLEARDRLSTLDLRCLVGLRVFVYGDVAKLVGATREACIAAGAKRVIAACPDFTTDTEGHIHG